MKKLLIALTAAAGLAGFAKADTTSLLEQGFEGIAGTKVTAGMLNASGQDMWVVPSGDCSELGLWANEAQFTPSGFPGAFQTFGDTFLGVSNAEPLRAAFGAINDGELPDVDIGKGLYVDTYVKFTATETAPTVSNGVDKLIVWMYGSDAEENPQTNLIVTAGHIVEGTVSAANYVVDATVEPDTWHRLTIKTKMVGDQKTAFRVYIDGTEVAITGKLVDGEIIDDLSVGDSGYQTGVTNDLAKTKLAKSQLFPSLISNGDKLSCVGLEGWGAVDDFVLTNVDPFEDHFENVEFTIAWDTNKFTSISYTLADVGTTEIKGDDLSKGSLTLSSKLAPSAVVTITGKPVDGYMVSAKAEGDCSVSETTFTMKAKDDLASGKATGTLVASEIAAIVTSNEVSTPFASLQDAVAGITGSGTITLLKGCTIVHGASPDVTIATGNEVVIDLNGQKITIDETGDQFDDTAPFILNQGTLTIKDKGAPDGEIISGDTKIVLNQGAMSIEAGKFTGVLVNNGGTASISGGTFLDDGKEFYLDDFVASGYEAAPAETEGYYTVTKKGDQPTTFTVTVAAADANSTVTVVSNGVTVAYAESYTLNEGESITVTYAPNTGYKFAGEQTTEFTLDADGEASEAPTATAISYTITFELGDGTWAEDGFTPPANYTIESEAIPLPVAADVTLEGYTFAGWFEKAEPSEADEAITTIAKGSTGDKTFYAKWEQNTPVGPSVGDNTYTNADEFRAAAKAGTTIKLPTDWTIVDNVIKDDKGNDWATLPSYYNISDGGAVSLNEAVVKPMVNNGTTNPGIVVGAKAAINVTNPQAGLFYILKRATTVNGPYEPVAYGITDTDDEDIQLTDPTKVDTAAFYKVEVTDVEPVLN